MPVPPTFQHSRANYTAYSATGLFLMTWMSYFDDYWSTYLGKWGWIGRLVERIVLWLPDWSIAISAHTQQFLLAHKIPTSRTYMITPGINLREIERVPISPVESDIIFVGRLVKEKRPDLALAVLAELDRRGMPVKGCIVGDGPERQKLEAFCEASGLSDKIIFTGAVNHDEVYSRMKSSKIFLFPSVLEGFGIVVAEANACGLPAVVVKAKHNASYWLVENGKNGYVCPVDVQKLADTVQRLLTNEPKRQMLSEQSRRFARQFDWDRLVMQTEQAYQQILCSLPSGTLSEN